MKWANKEHEFDERGNYLRGVETVYLWGAGGRASGYYNRFVWLGIENDLKIIFVDSNTAKQGKEYFGKPIISPEQFLRDFRDNGKMVLIITIGAQQSLYDIYTKWGFEDNREIVQGKNCFVSTENRTQILRDFFSVFMMYRYGKLLSVIQDVIATTKCTLNCERCLNYTQFNHHKRNYPIEQLKSDVDILFSKADYVDMLNISGGEINLHNELADLIDHIGKNYRSRIYEFLLIMNGTVIPSESVLRKMSEYKCLVRLDDYRDTVPSCRESIPKIVALFEEYKIDYYLFHVDEWINVSHDSTINFYMSDDRLIEYFDLCESPCKYIKNGRLYSCNYQAFAVEAGIAREDDSDYIYLDKASKMEILEFLLGYSQKGYCNYCKHCSGYFTINRNKIQPARQISRIPDEKAKTPDL